MYKITIETDPTLNGLDNKTVKKIIEHTFVSENIKESDVTIIFGNKELLKELKKQFFEIDKPTDVIAFRLNEYNDNNIEGEIYICLPVAKENSEYFGEPYNREIARLVIHGGLHLIGYDDDTDGNRNKMRELENKYLKELEF